MIYWAVSTCTFLGKWDFCTCLEWMETQTYLNSSNEFRAFARISQWGNFYIIQLFITYLECAPEKKRRAFINPWIDTGYIYHKQDDQSNQLPQITQLDESKGKRKLSTDPHRLLLVNGWCLPCRTDRSPFPSYAGLQNSIFSYNPTCFSFILLTIYLFTCLEKPRCKCETEIEN